MYSTMRNRTGLPEGDEIKAVSYTHLPTSLMLVGRQYSDFVIVCNVNNKPKLLLMRAEYGFGIGFKGKAFIKIRLNVGLSIVWTEQFLQ